MSEAKKDEWDLKFRGSSTCARMDTGLMIIELGKYNSAKELLIEDRETGLLRQVINRNMVWGASVTMAAVHMRDEGNRGQSQGSNTETHIDILRSGNEGRCRPIGPGA